jgi:hypothetical protein
MGVATLAAHGTCSTKDGNTCSITRHAKPRQTSRHTLLLVSVGRPMITTSPPSAPHMKEVRVKKCNYRSSLPTISLDNITAIKYTTAADARHGT